MSFKFTPGKMYRMPIQFGPGLGPRQLPEGRDFNFENAPAIKTVNLSFRSKPEQLRALLPDCFSLGDEPIVSIFASQMTGVDWLAGRGYSMLGFTFPAKFSGKVDQVEGSFLSVLFENMCEPIITGREELGFSKVFAEIDGPNVSDDHAEVAVSWHGFNFLTIKVNHLVEGSAEAQSNSKKINDGMLHYKYIPKTGDWGSADVEYPTFTPNSSERGRVLKSLQGEGSLSWNKAQWEDLPTLYNIVNTLADLEVLEYLGASLSYTEGTKDLREQRILS